MIGRLTGTVAHIGEDHALIDVGGVGYVVHCASRTLGALPRGGTVSLWTDLLVREDLLQLFGFTSLAEREWHRLLTTVQGVGAKVSLGILGTLGPEGVSQAIALGDATSIRRAPGVGPKLATRICNELKTKAPAMMGAEPGRRVPADGATPSDPLVEVPAAGPTGASADALSALANLGYAPAEAAEAVARAAREAPEADAGALIKTALKALAPGGG